MISGKLFETLDEEERKLWHSHVHEIKSGMLVMPGPAGVPTSVWEAAESKAMEGLVDWYGKTYHFWQVDRGDRLPLGKPELMMSFTAATQYPANFSQTLDERDTRLQISRGGKAQKRGYIDEPKIHPDADAMWSQV